MQVTCQPKDKVLPIHLQRPAHLVKGEMRSRIAFILFVVKSYASVNNNVHTNIIVLKFMYLETGKSIYFDH